MSHSSVPHIQEWSNAYCGWHGVKKKSVPAHSVQRVGKRLMPSKLVCKCNAQWRPSPSLPFILFCISCTTRVSQVTLCEQFEKFMHLALGFKFDRSHFDNWQCLNEGGSGSSKGTTFLCNVSHYCVDQRLQITGYNSSPLSFRFSYIAAFLPE